MKDRVALQRWMDHIASADSPVGMDALYVHALILDKLQDIEERLARVARFIGERLGEHGAPRGQNAGIARLLKPGLRHVVPACIHPAADHRKDWDERGRRYGHDICRSVTHQTAEK